MILVSVALPVCDGGRSLPPRTHKTIRHGARPRWSRCRGAIRHRHDVPNVEQHARATDLSKNCDNIETGGEQDPASLLARR